jgi:hypothetical protein
LYFLYYLALPNRAIVIVITIQTDTVTTQTVPECI